MESLDQTKGNGNIELESSSTNHDYHSQSNVIINNKEVKLVGKLGSNCETLLRVLALLVTLSAAVILGVNKQNKLVAIQIVDTLPPIRVPVSAKWHYLSAFVYFVVANAVACAYAALSLGLTLAKRGGKSAVVAGPIIVALDTVMMGLLFSSNSAAAAIGLIGLEGNSHVQWKKVCHVFGKFCNQTTVAIVVSFIGPTAFLLLVIVATKRLHNK